MKKASYYDEEYFDTNPNKGYPGPYTFTSAPWATLARCIVQALAPLSPHSATDFGCARGFLLYCLHTIYGWNVMGYDWSAYAAQTAMPNVPIEVIDITKRYPYKKADVVICMDVLEHIDEGPKLETAVANIRETAIKAAVVHVGLKDLDEGLPEHVTLRTRDWWKNYFANLGLITHVLEPTYRVLLKRYVPGKIGKMWYQRAFVLQPVEVHNEPKVEELPTDNEETRLSVVGDGATTEQEILLQEQ